MASPLIAAKAYAAVQSQAVGGGPTAVQPAGSSFADVLQTVVTDAVQASRNAEVQMKAQVQGKANLVDVVTAVASAETSLQTVLAVRDQVIQAYQQIMQMSI